MAVWSFYYGDKIHCSRTILGNVFPWSGRCWNSESLQKYVDIISCHGQCVIFKVKPTTGCCWRRRGLKQISLVPEFCCTYLNFESVSSNDNNVQWFKGSWVVFFWHIHRRFNTFCGKMEKRIVLHIEMVKIRYIMYNTHYTQKTSYIIWYDLFRKSQWAERLIYKWDLCAECNKITLTGEDLNTQSYRRQRDRCIL